MKKMIMSYGLIGLLLLSCNKKPDYQEVKDKELTLQVMQLDEEGGDDNGISYKIRIIPNKQLLEKTDGPSKTAMIYKMDSCFYLNIKNEKNYAALTQAIANGVGGTFEYLLEFKLNKQETSENIKLVYRDKYLNHKIYTIISNKK